MSRAGGKPLRSKSLSGAAGAGMIPRVSDGTSTGNGDLEAPEALAAIPQHPVETTDSTFLDLGLEPAVLEVVARIGFEHPTPIQAAVIPDAIAGKDLIGLAETGSGKTAAFVLPIVQRLRRGTGVRALIVSPTREIALQTKAFLDLFRKSRLSVNSACLIGGVKIGPQFDQLGGDPDVLVVTPGRLLDHVERGTASLGGVEELVLDEADHMLDLGFMPQIQRIVSQLPKQRHTMLFSATMLPPIERLAQRYMEDPLRIDLSPKGAAAGIEHRLYLIDEKDKKRCAIALLDNVPGSTLVFTKRRSDAEWLCRVLESGDHSVARIHSDRSQSHRVAALESFRAGRPPHPRSDEHRGPRHRRPGHRAHPELRPPRHGRGLHPPRRPYRPRRRGRRRVVDRHLARQVPDQADRERTGALAASLRSGGCNRVPRDALPSRIVAAVPLCAGSPSDSSRP